MTPYGLPADLVGGKASYFDNPRKVPLAEYSFDEITPDGVDDAAGRLKRFAPLIEKAFPETAANGGLIESPLRETDALKKELCPGSGGRLLVKLDSELPIAGSVKARGGIYEVLRTAEDIALENGVIDEGGDYSALLGRRDVFSRYSVQVGSTGNLGLSIGIMSAALGFRTEVHMSREAKEWKKELLRSRGAKVTEYDGDYGEAVRRGREKAESDPLCHFVDDERSADLFLGYATAGERLRKQLEDMDVAVDSGHPLCVYLPCGVGGAPGGITYGLKRIFGDDVKAYFVEPTACPCVTLGILSGENEKISVTDIGLSGVTDADGLAVSRPSGLVCRAVSGLVEGFFTVEDGALPELTRLIWKTENVFIEPSSCVAIDAYRRSAELTDENATHVIWATGGSLVPQIVREKVLFG